MQPVQSIVCIYANKMQISSADHSQHNMPSLFAQGQSSAPHPRVLGLRGPHYQHLISPHLISSHLIPPSTNPGRRGKPRPGSACRAKVTNPAQQSLTQPPPGLFLDYIRPHLCCGAAFPECPALSQQGHHPFFLPVPGLGL